MEPMLDGEDYSFIQDALQEMSGLTDRLIRLIRNTGGFTGGTLDGVAPSPVQLSYDIMASVDSVTQDEVTNSGGQLTLGDLKVSIPMDVVEKTIQPTQGDKLLFEGYTWYIVGKAERVYIAGLEYSVSKWHQT